MNDFYAFCRLVDDLADETMLPLSARRTALNEVEAWIQRPGETQSSFWNRFNGEINSFKIPTEALLGIIRGVRKDLDQPKIQIETWRELDDYVYGVACCVGRGVLAILGANDSNAETYALWMGRHVQYLNILRDLESDLHQGKVYIPKEFLKTIDGLHSPSGLTKAREEIFRRALEARRNAKPYSRHCLIAEIMGGIYLNAARRYWIHGHAHRLSSLQKIMASFEILIRFVFARESLSR